MKLPRRSVNDYHDDRDDDTTRPSTTVNDYRCRNNDDAPSSPIRCPLVTAAFVRVREDQVPEYPEHRRPRSPERQGPLQRRPEYDYFQEVDYLDSG